MTRGRRASTLPSCRVRGLPLGVRPAPAGHLLGHRLPGRCLPAGVKPVTLWTLDRPTRVLAEGGTGAAKCGGTTPAPRAGQPRASSTAGRPGRLPRLLDAHLHRGARGTNLFLVTKDGRIITPELTGTILEGVTRSPPSSTSPTEQGTRARGAPHPDRGVEGGAASGDIVDGLFAARTRRRRHPVGELRWAGGSVDHHRRDGHEAATPRRSAARLLDIQYAAAPSDLARLAHPPRLTGPSPMGPVTGRARPGRRSVTPRPGSSRPTSTAPAAPDGSLSGRTAAAWSAAGAAGIETVLVTARPPRWLHGPGRSSAARHGDLRQRRVRLRGGHPPGPRDAPLRRRRRRGRRRRPASRRAVGDVRGRAGQWSLRGRRLPGPAPRPGRSRCAGGPGARSLPSRSASCSRSLLTSPSRSSCPPSRRSSATWSGAHGLAEINASGVTKAAGLERWATGLGIDAAQSTGFGAQRPADVLRVGRVGWAVANGHERVRRAADRLCPPNDDDGVAHVLFEVFFRSKGLIQNH